MTVAGRIEARESTTEHSPQQRVLSWWRESIANEHAPTGPRAELRKARTLEEVVFVPLFHDLRRRLGATGWRRTDRLALVAGVLTHVRGDDNSTSFASQMSGNPPVVKPPRFRRLLRFGDGLEDLEQVFLMTRRVVSLLDRRANVTDLARSLYWWNAETRKRWALDYYEHVNERSLKSD
jgi:CRISPR system Cascade subunit CasB